LHSLPHWLALFADAADITPFNNKSIRVGCPPEAAGLALSARSGPETFPATCYLLIDLKTITCLSVRLP